MNELTTATIELFKNRPARLSLKEVAASADVTINWLHKFQQGKIDCKYKPSKEKIERLNRYLVSIKS